MKDTYTCGWCKWKGTKIAEQQAQTVAVFTGTTNLRVKRYACWVCGQEVFPDK